MLDLPKIIVFRGFAAAFENIKSKNLYFLISGSAFFPLCWLVINESDDFDFFYVLFALVVAFTVTFFQFIFLRFLRKIDAQAFSWFNRVLFISFVALNIWAFALCALDIRLRYSFLLSYLFAFVWIFSFSCVALSRARKFFLISLMFLALTNAIISKYHTLPPKINDDFVKQSSAVGLNKNVYILVFDSLISSEAYHQIYDSKDPPWLSYLEKNGFRLIEHVESAGDSTLSSFGVLYNFGLFDQHLSMTGKNNRVYEYFINSGYKIAMLSDMGYFGSSKTNSLDYLYPSYGYKSLCAFSPPIFLYNACLLLDNNTGNLDVSHLLHDFDRFLSARSSKKKWFTTVYTWYPGHSPSSNIYQFDGALDTSRWHSTYISSVNSSLPVIDGIVGKVLKHDPNSIILVFGDHGSINFRSVSSNENPTVSENDVYLDRYGVTFAVYPKTLCPDTFRDGYSLKNLFKDFIHCAYR
jgi:hypothetical protein